jgi:hypothetical protein
VKVFYDTEFLEDGKTIELISIGMVREDGAELYCVNRDAPWKRIKHHEWLMANVVPGLPQPHGDWIRHMPKSWPIDFNNPAVKDRAEIAAEVRRFLLDSLGEPELWAWYGAYDHVVLAQLFGRMIDLPTGIPMWTNDLRQEVHRLDNPTMPEQPSGLHNALEDARHLRVMHDHLTALASGDDPAAGCVDCAKDVFHSRHTTVAERQAQRSALAEALRTAPAGESRTSATEGEETR